MLKKMWKYLFFKADQIREICLLFSLDTQTRGCDSAHLSLLIGSKVTRNKILEFIVKISLFLF